ncbi:uncharacterized protein LOC109615554 isoform X3 [Esox lucius]|uniref:uncharacterized protein LOC109615554 isoform X3 n=1 Tax=Esox lucius TaxID=8010 RepID=UPI001477159D|nr:uncharacterized protein LOC109615554 isoform X3 [Esox lucius]
MKPLTLISRFTIRELPGCSDTSIDSDFGDQRLLSGQSFNLTCKFSCLKSYHTVQWWKDDHVLLSASSIQGNISLCLHVSDARVKDSGNYSCKTQPPDAIGTVGVIVVEDLPTAAVSTATVPTIKTKAEILIVGVACYLLLKAGLLITMVTTVSIVLSCLTD